MIAKYRYHIKMYQSKQKLLLQMTEQQRLDLNEILFLVKMIQWKIEH